MGTDQPTNRPTDGRTGKAGCRVACTRLKKHIKKRKKKVVSVSKNDKINTNPETKQVNINGKKEEDRERKYEQKNCRMSHDDKPGLSLPLSTRSRL